MSPLNITQPLGIWSIMATIRWCPIAPSHGTFTNPCITSYNIILYNQLRFHRATCIRQNPAIDLASIELDHGGHIVGPTVETTRLCYAGFVVLTGRKSQGPHDMAAALWPMIPMKETNVRLLSTKKMLENAWCSQDSNLSANLHCQWWRFHCGSLCKKKHSSTSHDGPF